MCLFPDGPMKKKHFAYDGPQCGNEPHCSDLSSNHMGPPWESRSVTYPNLSQCSETRRHGDHHGKLSDSGICPALWASHELFVGDDTEPDYDLPGCAASDALKFAMTQPRVAGTLIHISASFGYFS
jgi:hypothetical protein